MVQYNSTPPRNQPLRLLEQVRVAIRAKHYSLRTEDTYVQWIRQFILFHDKRHPQAMGGAEVQQFLTDLAVAHQVAASTQNQALSAPVFCIKKSSTKTSAGSTISSAPKSPPSYRWS